MDVNHTNPVDSVWSLGSRMAAPSPNIVVLTDEDYKLFRQKLGREEQFLISQLSENTEGILKDDEVKACEEIRDVVGHLARVRGRFSITQLEVSKMISYYCGTFVSRTTVCHFEAMQLPFERMKPLANVFKSWLNEVDANIRKEGKVPTTLQHESLVAKAKTRNRRTVLANDQLEYLESIFIAQPRLSTIEKDNVARRLNLPPAVVRTWFYNRTQKEKNLARLSNPLREAVTIVGTGPR